MTGLVINRHPLTLAGRQVLQATPLLPGETLAAFLTRHEVDLAEDGWVVAIDGAEVPALMWARTRPKHAQLITCRRVPGKEVLRAVAFVVLAYYTFGAGATAEGAWAAGGGFGTFAAQAGAYMLGAAVINRVLPPPRARLDTYTSETGSTYSLQGGRNRMRAYEPLGILFGQTKVVPDFCAQPYAWFQGDDQYQAVRLHAGLNVGAVADMVIGPTPITSFTGVTISKRGFSAGNTAQFLDWANVDTIAGGVLDFPVGGGGAVPVLRTSSPNTTRLALDFAASLYSMADDGSMSTTRIRIKVETRRLPATLWDDRGEFELTSVSTKPTRATYEIDLVNPGQFEVRCTKRAGNVSTGRASNEVEWVALKSYQQASTAFDAFAQVSVRIKASGQLTGVLDELSWIGTQEAVPLWNGSAWVTQVTSNPGAHILQLARGIFGADGRLHAGLGYADTQIDIEGLKAFMVHCTTNGYTFDHWQDRVISCLDLMEAMAAVGMGTLSRHTGRLGVVWMAAGQPVEDVVNMANMRRGTFRVDYAARQVADELEVSWFDAASGYANKSVRMLAPGVIAPRDTARLSPIGIRTEAGAVRMGRQAMAQNLYGRKAVTWQMDAEYMAFHRYSVIRLSHDLTRWGRGGRLHAAVNTAGVVTLQLDAEVPSGATPYVGLRIPGEAGVRIFQVAAFSGTVHQVTLVGAWPSGVPFPGDSAGNPAHDTIWIFDFTSAPGQRLRVTDIKPQNNLQGAEITAVPEPDDFWTYMASGTYTVSSLPAPIAPPAVSNIRVTQRRLDVNYSNSTELSITWDASGTFASAQVWGGRTDEALQLLGTTTVPRWSPWIVSNDGTYAIEVRPFDSLGRPGTAVGVTYDPTLGAITGTGASLLKLIATGLAFTFNGSGAAAPSSQTLVFTAQLTNLAGSVTWTAELFNAAGSSLGLVALGGTGNSNRTLTVAQFISLGAAVRAVVTTTLGSVSDVATVVKLSDGANGSNGSNGENGQNAITGQLTNESAVVAADAAGTVGSFAGTGGTFKVYDGIVDKTGDSSVTYSVQSSSGVTIGIASTGVYTITAMSADIGNAVLRAVYGSVTIDRIYNIAKSRAGSAGANGTNGTNGTNGANAQLLALLASGQTFTFDGSNAASPGSQTLSFTAALQNLSGSVTFTCTLYDVGGGNLGTVALGGSGNSNRTLTVAQFTSLGAAVRAEVLASLSAFSDQVTVVKLKDGANGANGSNGTNGSNGQNSVTGLLTNESAVVAADSAGTVGSFAGAGGTFKVYDGTTDKTGDVAVTYSVQSSTGVTIGIASTGVYTITAMSADTATATLRAVYGSVTVDKVYSIAKSKAGTNGSNGSNGTNAQLLALLASGQTFTFDGSNAASPGSQTLSFTAALQNLSGSVTFTCTLYDVGGGNLGTVALGGSGNGNRTLTVAQFISLGAAARAEVLASLSGFSDQVTVVKLKDGANGANGSNGSNGSNGQNAVTGLLTNESAVVAADSAGTVGTFSGAGGTFKVYDGITDKTGNAAVTYSVLSSSGVTIGIAATGVYTVTAMSADAGEATLRAVYGSVTIDKVYNIAKSKAGTNGSNGSNGSNGQDAISSVLSQAAVVLPADYSGVVLSFDGATTTMRVYRGNADDSGNWTFGKNDGSGITSGISGNTVTITAASVDVGYVDITATRSGFPTQTLRLGVVKARSATVASGVVSPGPFCRSSLTTGSAVCVAGIKFKADGNIGRRANGLAATTTYNNFANWYSPTGGTPGSGLFIRFVMRSSESTSGSTPAGTGSGLGMGSDRTVTLTHDFGNSGNAVIDYYISTDSAGFDVVSNGVIELESTCA